MTKSKSRKPFEITDEMLLTDQVQTTNHMPKGVRYLLAKLEAELEPEFEVAIFRYQVILAALVVALDNIDENDPTNSPIFKQLKRIIDLKNSNKRSADES